MKISEFLNEQEEQNRKYKVDTNTQKILKTLHDKGFVAYVAGGYVRDLAMGGQPNDVDIVTNATPDEVEASFPKTYGVGKAFGVIVVTMGGEDYEIATFRSDKYGSTADGRRPDSVTFGNEKDDSERRDFSINAMYLDTRADKIIDYHSGMEDIKNKVIRFIGDPQGRINEDYLRILRAIRFAVRFGFTIEPRSWEAIKKNAPNITKISQERITDEIMKTLKLGRPRQMIEMLDDSQLLQYVLPEVYALKDVKHDAIYHHGESGLEHTIEVMERIVGQGVRDQIILFAGMVHDIGKPGTATEEGDAIHYYGHEGEGVKLFDKMAERMKLSGAEKDRISWIIENHMMQGLEETRMSKFKRLVANPYFKDLFIVAKADKLGLPKNKDKLDVINARLKKVEEEGAKPKPLITGKDLIDAGIKPGPIFRKVLEDVYDAQLEGRISTREAALEMMRAMI